jgi:hypothetical protein
MRLCSSSSAASRCRARPALPSPRPPPVPRSLFNAPPVPLETSTLLIYSSQMRRPPRISKGYCPKPHLAPLAATSPSPPHAPPCCLLPATRLPVCRVLHCRCHPQQHRPLRVQWLRHPWQSGWPKRTRCFTYHSRPLFAPEVSVTRQPDSIEVPLPTCSVQQAGAAQVRAEADTAA